MVVELVSVQFVGGRFEPQLALHAQTTTELFHHVLGDLLNVSAENPQ